MPFALFLRLQGRLERPQSSLHEPADRLAAGHGRTQRLLPHRAQLATHFGNTFHDVILSSKKRGHLVAPARLLDDHARQVGRPQVISSVRAPEDPQSRST